MTAAPAAGPTVLDASVVVEWFSPSAPAVAARALALLGDVQARPREFAVPSLLFHEVHAVLCRRLASDGDVDTALGLLYALAMHVVPFDRSTEKAATRLARAHGLTGYDATYAATAKAVGGIWATLDQKAHARIRVNRGLPEGTGERGSQADARLSPGGATLRKPVISLRLTRMAHARIAALRISRVV